jgi:hypothetical protein
MGFLVDNVTVGNVSPSTSVSPPNHLSFGAGIIGEIVADVPYGLSLTRSHETKKKTTLGTMRCWKTQKGMGRSRKP